MESNTDGVNLAVIGNDIKHIRTEVSEINRKLESNYVTKEAFEPVKRLVFGVVALVMASFIGGVIALVIRK